MLALSRGLWEIRSQWLDQVILPHLMKQSLYVESRDLPPGMSYIDGQSTSAGQPIDTGICDCPHSATASTQRQRETIGSGCPSKQAGYVEANALPTPERGQSGRDANDPPREAVSRERRTKHQPHRQRRCIASPVIGQDTRREPGCVNLQPYTEIMRSILRTAMAGLFSSDVCTAVVDLMVSMCATSALGEPHHIRNHYVQSTQIESADAFNLTRIKRCSYVLSVGLRWLGF